MLITIIIARLHVDWSGMVYSCAGSLDYFIFGCLTANFMCLRFSPSFSGSSREIDIIVFAEVNWIFHILKFCTFSLKMMRQLAAVLISPKKEHSITLAKLKPF